MAIINNISTLLLFLFCIALSLNLSLCSTKNHSILTQGSSMSVDKPNSVIVSPKGTFSAGFYAVGKNAYCFGIWFSKNPTLVWMANRDYPVNGKHSKLSLLSIGNLVLLDADKSHVWSTNTFSPPSSTVHLVLYDTGNLVLMEDRDRNNRSSTVLWQSFDYPTDTLLPEQVFTRSTKLISSKSKTNKSTGLYTLFFDNDNVLRLLYDGPEVSGLYWPDPLKLDWNNDRSSYNNSRVAVLDTLGIFISSDNFTFMTSDFGSAAIQRRITLAPNGNLLVYSRSNDQDHWYVSWQAFSRPCKIHGVCGPNSLCTFHTNSTTRCSCLPGHKMKQPNDWSYGCEPRFSQSCQNNESASRFISISNVEFYGYDYGLMINYTLDQCKDLCLQLCDCRGFQYTYNKASGTNKCYIKLQLRNGYRVTYCNAEFYVKLPANSTYSFHDDQVSIVSKNNNLDCPVGEETVQLERSYIKWHVSRYVKFLLWFAGGVGIFEMLCIFVVWYFLVRFRVHSGADKGVYDLVGFRRFSYSELKQATKGFSQEIGKGAWGSVYKGVLSDGRVAAVKRLMEANQGEEEFLAEVSSIGRLNHMNLIEMWGYCAERKHRLLVYEHMEHGSLAENLRTNRLDLSQKFEIALGTAKGLCYLHDECLDWILHCDVKPQNILLDSNFQPKIADFGLSKLLKRSDTNNDKYSSFSKIRGTRGYMAPEWVLNLPITSKVDVYSYGIVVLEMFTGKSPTKNVWTSSDGVENNNQHMYLVAWLREKQNKGFRSGWVCEILDPSIEGDYDENKLEALATVALQCVQDEMDKRPTMSQVVEMLQKYL